MVWSPNYGAWLFTTSDKAWEFMKDAIYLLGNKTTWNIDKTPEEVIKSWHHPWELCILERIDKNVEDLKKLVEEVDKIDWDKMLDEHCTEITVSQSTGEPAKIEATFEVD